MAEIMDVSRYQGTIDWEKVKASGKVDGVMIRAMGNSAEGLPSKPYTDPQFARNYAECKRMGIPCGVYGYFKAVDREQADKELAYFKKLLTGRPGWPERRQGRPRHSGYGDRSTCLHAQPQGLRELCGRGWLRLCADHHLRPEPCLRHREPDRTDRYGTGRCVHGGQQRALVLGCHHHRPEPLQERGL